MSSLKKNYEKAMTEFIEGNPTCQVQFQQFETVRENLRRTRLKYLDVVKTEFSKSIDVMLPEMIAKNFLVSEYEIDSDNKMLIFCQRSSQKVMQLNAKENKMVFGDGTFKVVPQPFCQLFTLHVDLNSCNYSSNVRPAIYALLPNKSTSTYTAFFTIVRDVLKVNIKTYKCDYELAQIIDENGL